MMTPGSYLAKRRRAAGLSIDDVAAMVSTSPRLAKIDRHAWIERVEQDVAALSPDVVFALRAAFNFQIWVLAQLIEYRTYGKADPLPHLCASCGCSDRDPCIDPDNHDACAWATEDLCTSCAPSSQKDAVQ